MAVLSGERADYREACGAIRAARAIEDAQAAPQLRESPAPGVDPPAVPRPPQNEPEAPPAAVGEQLIAEADSLPDTILSDAEVEEVRRRLPGEGPVRIPGVDPPDMRGWRPLDGEIR